MRKLSESPVCLNCASQLQGAYCHVCGQQNLPPEETMGELLHELWDSLLNVNGKFFSSLLPLLTRPGFLTREYFLGRRARYYNPLRLYLSSSFIYFLLFFSISDIGSELNANVNNTPESEAAASADSTSNKLHIQFGDENVDVTSFASIAAYDSTQALLPESERHNLLMRYMVRKGIRLYIEQKEQPAELARKLIGGFLQTLPNVIFFILPFFALILKGLYFRRHYYYIQHLVFSLHAFSFFFVLFSLRVVLKEIAPDANWLAVLPAILMGYTYLAMKHFYGQSWMKTAAKYFLLLMGFAILLGTGVIAGLALAVIQM